MIKTINHDISMKDIFEKLTTINNNLSIRKSQLELSQDILDIIKDDYSQFFISEAPTGVGKSFAYLLPIILYKKTAIITTVVKNLQDQLYFEDIPNVIRMINILVDKGYLNSSHYKNKHNFKYELLKGKDNYLCINKLMPLVQKAKQSSISSLLSNVKLINDTNNLDNIIVEYQIDNENTKVEFTKKLLLDIYKWQSNDNNKDFDSLGKIKLKPDQKKFLAHNNKDCTWKLCDHYDSCQLKKSRDRIKHSDIIITNNDSFIYNLNNSSSTDINDEDINLNNRSVIVFDEAHNLADKIISINTLSTTQKHIIYLLDSLTSPQTEALIRRFKKEFNEFISLLNKTTDIIEDSKNKYKQSNEYNKTYLWHNVISNNYNLLIILNRAIEFFNIIISISLKEKLETIEKLSENYKHNNVQDKKISLLEIKEIEKEIEEVDYINKLLNIFNLKIFYPDENGEILYIIKSTENNEFTFGIKPINAYNGFKTIHENIINKECKWIFTSATLADSDGRFNYFINSLKLDQYDELKSKIYSSPYDKQDQALIYISKIKNKNNDYELNKDAIQLIIQNEGNALWLCTSIQRVKKIYSQLNNYFKNSNKNWNILAQTNSNTSKVQMIQDFCDNNNSILIATRSFWEGVNIKGKDLSLLIIDKYPFSNISSETNQFKLELYNKIPDKNYYIDYLIPESFQLLKQGIGRLIRSENDYGIILILDDRIVNNNNYIWNTIRQNIIKSYYKYRHVDNIEECINFLDRKNNESTSNR